jgi:hypothetical protein
LVALTLIISFSEMLKYSDLFFKKKLWKEILNLKNNLFVKMNISKLINWWTKTCVKSCQRITIMESYCWDRICDHNNLMERGPQFFQNFLRLKIVLYHRFWPGDKQNCYLSKFTGTSMITQNNSHEPIEV